MVWDTFRRLGTERPLIHVELSQLLHEEAHLVDCAPGEAMPYDFLERLGGFAILQ